MILLISLLFNIIFSKENAVILILCRNREKDEIAKTIENLEIRFNKNYRYPYVFLNDKKFTPEFKDKIKETIPLNASVEFGQVSPEDWNPPKEINMEIAKIKWEEMGKKNIPYAGLESYHNMCRFFSRKFYKHPLILKYKYYWRVEPGVKFHCDILDDPFEEMERKNKKYGFVITLHEFMDTIPTLMRSTRQFLIENYTSLPKVNNFNFMFDKGKYNGCHFWSNFEIGNFEFFRSDLYNNYVDKLEKDGGFYYERWGDAPVHSIAASLFLDKSEIVFFDKIGYTHENIMHCPKNGVNCDCDVNKSVDFTPYSCLQQFLNNQ